MGGVVDGLLGFAASRWPGGGGDELAREWRAELATLPTRRERLAFAGSLAVAAVGGVEVAGAVSGIGLVALLAGAGFNGVHLVGHTVGGVAAGGFAVVVAVIAAAGGMAWLGRRWAGRSPVGIVIGLGLAVGAFLLAGNRVAVMPYMGWVDLGPGVAAWTVVMLAAAVGAARLLATGRRRVAAAVAGLGGLVALDAAAGFGSAHAAVGLGVPLPSAPLWLPLALLPGGTVRFGAYHADGTGRFGGRLVTGPAFHGSDVLLGNVSAMVGPLLLCTAFVTAAVLAGSGVAGSRDVRESVDGRRAAFAAVAMVAVLLAPPADGVRAAELAALLWLAAGAAAVSARQVPFGRGVAAMVAFGPAVVALVAPDLVRPLAARAVLAVAALAVARVTRADRNISPWVGLAAGAALLARSVDVAMRAPGAVADTVVRIEHNTAEFGFGFVGTPAGALLLVALIGVAVSRWRVGVAAHGS